MEYKVLLAEDEYNLRNIVSKYLSKNGLIVDTASNGNEAMVAVEYNVYDIIILDIMMPIKNGIEVCKYTTGAVLGLVAIIPGAGFVPIWASVIIGFVVSPICYYMMSAVKKKLGYDDALDAFGCHGIGGVWGGIATGIFADKSINGALHWNGLIYGEWELFGAQILSIVITIAIAIVGTLICVVVVRLFTPLRVSEAEERVGLDRAEHGEEAYPAFNGLD